MGRQGCKACAHRNSHWVTMADTIQLYREEPVHPGGPHTADVHKDEAEAWLQQGWRIATPAAAAPDAMEEDEAMGNKPKPKPKPKGK